MKEFEFTKNRKLVGATDGSTGYDINWAINNVTGGGGQIQIELDSETMIEVEISSEGIKYFTN